MSSIRKHRWVRAVCQDALCSIAVGGRCMEPDSSLDFVVDDLPGIGRSYQMTGTNGGRITVVGGHAHAQLPAGGGRISASIPRDSSEYSICRSATGWVA